MAAVKEREITAVVATPPKSESFSSTGPRGPTEPPTPPGGGRGGGGKLPYLLVLLVLALIPFGLTLRTYMGVLGDTPATEIIAYAAWVFLTLSFAKCSLLAKEEASSRPRTFEHAVHEFRNRVSQRFWDGLLIMVCCFHLAVFLNVTSMILIIEFSISVITAACTLLKGRGPISFRRASPTPRAYLIYKV
jgi:hypothetical protein